MYNVEPSIEPAPQSLGFAKHRVPTKLRGDRPQRRMGARSQRWPHFLR
jgi:hypothetical protein